MDGAEGIESLRGGEGQRLLGLQQGGPKVPGLDLPIRFHQPGTLRRPGECGHRQAGRAAAERQFPVGHGAQGAARQTSGGSDARRPEEVVLLHRRDGGQRGGHQDRPVGDRQTEGALPLAVLPRVDHGGHGRVGRLPQLVRRAGGAGRRAHSAALLLPLPLRGDLPVVRHPVRQACRGCNPAGGRCPARGRGDRRADLRRRRDNCAPG